MASPAGLPTASRPQASLRGDPVAQQPWERVGGRPMPLRPQRLTPGYCAVMAKSDATLQRAQLQKQRRKVDFDTYDITVDELVRRVSQGRIEIAPSYQRQFRWDDERQSRLVESLLLGIPVPPLFMATNVTEGEGTSWEVVDGLQRLLSITNFLGDEATRRTARLEGTPLRLRSLDILEALEGVTADEMPADLRSGLLDRPMKVIVLNDKSDLQVRFDLFERLNTGGIKLTNHEVREAVFMGEFIDLLTELARTESFRHVVRFPKARENDGTPQDFVLRFFAFHDRYKSFDHSVNDFLNAYCRDAVTDPRIAERRLLFNKTFSFLAQAFPAGGIRRRPQTTTPVNLYEGVAVGAALALAEKPDLKAPANADWVDSPRLREFTTGATNDRRRVAGRIEYCRDRFLTAK